MHECRFHTLHLAKRLRPHSPTANCGLDDAGRCMLFIAPSSLYRRGTEI